MELLPGSRSARRGSCRPRLVFPETQGVVGYNDIDPRFGVAYDLFGNGKTALKFNLGRYLEAAVRQRQLLVAAAASRIVTSVTRSWTDANGNYTPDCDLADGSAQDLRAGGGDFCGALSNQNFGKNIYSLSYDEQILKGWGVRPSDWLIAATVQHELLPRVSLSVGYTRRWLQNFTVTDNRATTADDYTPFSITAPLDPRLPGGGGYVVSGLYNVVPASSMPSTTTAPTRLTTGRFRRCTTASTSTSRPGCGTASSFRPAASPGNA